MNTEAEFKEELKALLIKYNITMSIEDDDGYATTNFFRLAKYDWDDEMIPGKTVMEMINWNIRGTDSNGEFV